LSRLTPSRLPTMVAAWYVDGSSEEERWQPNQMLPNFAVPGDKLSRLGAEHYADGAGAGVKRAVAEHGLARAPELVLAEAAGQAGSLAEALWVEHARAGAEVLVALQGAGYIDVRDSNDRWIRVRLGEGEALCLPAGMYRRVACSSKSQACKLARWRKDGGKQGDELLLRTELDAADAEHEARVFYVAKYAPPLSWRQWILTPSEDIDYDVVVTQHMVGLACCAILLLLQFLLPGEKEGEPSQAQGWWIVCSPFAPMLMWSYYVRVQWRAQKQKPKSE